MNHCPRCRKQIFSGETTGESGVYGSWNISDLCEPCFFDEEKEIDEKGTNDLPETLSLYRQNMKLNRLRRA